MHCLWWKSSTWLKNLQINDKANQAKKVTCWERSTVIFSFSNQFLGDERCCWRSHFPHFSLDSASLLSTLLSFMKLYPVSVEQVGWCHWLALCCTDLSELEVCCGHGWSSPRSRVQNASCNCFRHRVWDKVIFYSSQELGGVGKTLKQTFWFWFLI